MAPASVDNLHYEDYGYNDRNELLTADYYSGAYPNGINVPAKDFAYAYDPIGNRTDSTAGTAATMYYCPNNLNQYPTLDDDSSDCPPQSPDESLTYDFDGNLKTTDASGTYNDWTYTWDAENRLVEAVKTTPSYGAQKVQFAYDYLGRRVEKKVYVYVSYGFALAPPAWYLYVHRKFVWGGPSPTGGWLLLEELNGKSSDAVVRKYTWGLDLAGLSGAVNSLEGAGTIGGLLAHEDHAAATTRNFVYFYDGNGNVGQLMNLADATLTCWAKYEYDPYGGLRAIYEHSDYSGYDKVFAFRFSTKYYDGDAQTGPSGTGLYYFGYRYYSPRLGRWISRDPIEEDGGYLLYAYVLNSPLQYFDAHGACEQCGGSGYPPGTPEDWIHRQYTATHKAAASKPASSAPAPPPCEKDPGNQACAAKEGLSVTDWCNNKALYEDFVHTSSGVNALEKVCVFAYAAVAYTNIPDGVTNDKWKHCFIGCMVAYNCGTAAGCWIGSWKELQDLTDCDPTTHFERADDLATCTGAQNAPMWSPGGWLGCYCFCDDQYGRK